MKRIEIIGENHFGAWKYTRAACRGIVLCGDRILLSYEARTGQYMIPGGGLEAGETEAECCRREVAEETGVLARVGECAVEIDEFYEDWKYVSHYFLCTPEGACEPRPTEREREVGMEPRWLPLDEAVAEFSRHAEYAVTDEMRRGLYLREYTALRALAGRRRAARGDPEVYLLRMTAELYQAYFREYENPPDLYADPSQWAAYVYDPAWVDRYIQRQRDPSRRAFAVMYGDDMVGEVILKDITPRTCATLSICMRNERCRDRGFGTRAERLAIQYAFGELDLPVLYADALRANARSRHVLEKVGFRPIREEGDFIFYRIERRKAR